VLARPAFLSHSIRLSLVPESLFSRTLKRDENNREKRERERGEREKALYSARALAKGQQHR